MSIDQRAITEIDLHVGVRIRQRRVERGLSQDKLARATGVTFQQIQKYENGNNRISAGRLLTVARALDTPIAWFFEGIGTEMEPAVPDEAEAPDLNEARKEQRLLRDLRRIAEPRIRKRIAELVAAIAREDEEE